MRCRSGGGGGGHEGSECEELEPEITLLFQLFPVDEAGLNNRLDRCLDVTNLICTHTGVVDR